MLNFLKRILVFVLAWGMFQVAHAQNTPAVSAETRQHIKDVETGLTPSVVLKDDPHPTHGLGERMTALHVPGVTIAVIHHGAIEWAQGFGVTSLGGPPVTAETLFQASAAVTGGHAGDGCDTVRGGWKAGARWGAYVSRDGGRGFVDDAE